MDLQNNSISKLVRQCNKVKFAREINVKLKIF